jgi:major membrane immunogen (membrane-anchored lipoprotein)
MFYLLKIHRVMTRKYFALIAFAFLISCKSTEKPKCESGVYVGQSHSIYGSESFVGVTRLTVKDGHIQNVDFQIIDSLKNEVFDQNYDSHYPDNELYREQCHKDWQGVLNYPKQLLEKQDINKVDAVSGATWSYNLFVSSAKIALQQSGAKLSEKQVAK